MEVNKSLLKTNWYMFALYYFGVITSCLFRMHMEFSDEFDLYFLIRCCHYHYIMDLFFFCFELNLTQTFNIGATNYSAFLARHVLSYNAQMLFSFFRLLFV